MNAYRYDRLKVLVIDDNAHMRSLIVAVLLAFGVKSIVEAASADEGWRQLCASGFDIAFCDWVMEGQTGIEFTKRLRNAPGSPNPYLPVIMLSGHSSPERIEAARNAGVNEFLAKPVTAKSILAKLASAIDHPRPFVRTKNYFGPCRRRDEDAYRGPERRVEKAKTIEPKPATASAA